MRMPSGCTGGGGIARGPRAYACPGAISQGQAAGRCASGWQLCTDGNLIDQPACNDASNQKLQGFFVAEVPPQERPRSPPTSSPAASPTSTWTSACSSAAARPRRTS